MRVLKLKSKVANLSQITVKLQKNALPVKSKLAFIKSKKHKIMVMTKL